MWLAWHESKWRYWCPFVDLQYRSVTNSPCWILIMTSRKFRISLERSWINLILGWKLLRRFRDSSSSFSVAVQIKKYHQLSKPNAGLNLFVFEKFSFNVIHKDACIRWSKFSSNSRSQNLMFTRWIKFKIILLENKFNHFTRSSLGIDLLSNVLSCFLKTSVFFRVWKGNR